MRRSKREKKGPIISSPLRAQGLIINAVGQRVTFSLPDHRSVVAEMVMDGDQQILMLTCFPGGMIVWPFTANRISLMVSK